MITWLLISLAANLLGRYVFSNWYISLLPANAFISAICMLTNRQYASAGILVGMVLAIGIMVIVNRMRHRGTPVA